MMMRTQIATVARAGRRGVRPWVLGLVLVAAACADPLGPEELPCTVPPSLMVVQRPAVFDTDGLITALRHAAGPMASALGSTDLAASLTETIELVAYALGDGLPRTGCRIVQVAADRLDRLPDDPATLPDREGIRLILSVAATAVAYGQARAR